MGEGSAALRPIHQHILKSAHEPFAVPAFAKLLIFPEAIPVKPSKNVTLAMIIETFEM